MLNKKSIFVFGKAQLSAFVGGICDWMIMVMCVEWFHVHYVASIWISGFIGAMVNFTINKYYTFGATQENLSNQLFKFYLVVVGSVALKSMGTYLMTEGLSVDYKISRIAVDLVVSLGYNFTLQRYWVFRKSHKKTESTVLDTVEVFPKFHEYTKVS